MIVDVNFASLKSTKPHEYALRFLFGGIVTVTAGIIARRIGPGIGGLFLAFPAIFPASATLIEITRNSASSKQVTTGPVEAARRRPRCRRAFLGALALLLFAFVIYRLFTQPGPSPDSRCRLADMAGTVGSPLVPGQAKAGHSVLVIFRENNSKIACQVPKPPKLLRDNNIRVAF